MFRRTFIRSAIAASAVFALAACGGGNGGDPLAGGGDAGGGDAPAKIDSITVGSANVAESHILAEI